MEIKEKNIEIDTRKTVITDFLLIGKDLLAAGTQAGFL